MSMKTGCLGKVESCKQDLVEWLKTNPSVILRWLHDAGALRQETYFRLLETRPEKNQITSILELMLQNEESCRTFLNVLQQVQEHYGPELQKWLKDSFPSIYKQPANVIDIERIEKKSTWGRIKGALIKAKKYNLEPADQRARTINRSSPIEAQKRPDQTSPPPLEVPLKNYKQSMLKMNTKLQGKLHTSKTCCEMMEIRYTELFITNEDPVGLPGEHEYLMLAKRRARIYEHNRHQKISLTDIFSSLVGESSDPRRVLVTGIAGIGKTSAMQRLIHEWAIGKAFTNIICVIHFVFRELSLLDKPLSLLDLIKLNHPQLNGISEDICKQLKGLMVVLDGLDEFKHSIGGGMLVKGLNDQAPIKDLIYSLLKGSLLPGASIVVTSRPQPCLPLEIFDRKVVILGFEEKQVKEFCSRFFREEEVTEEVFQYIMKNDTISGLCFIPLYCFIICSVLGPYFQKTSSCLEGPPKTMTEVYRSYLCTLLHLRDNSSNEEVETEEAIVLCCPPIKSSLKTTLYQLGKLAYHCLLEGKILFSKDDLEKFGFRHDKMPDTFMDRIFVHVDGKNKSEMFSFFHMTIQEFFAALFCVMTLGSSPEELFQCLNLWCFGSSPAEPVQSQLLSTTMESMTANRYENLQMFTRFFMGLLCYRIEGKLKGLVGPFENDHLGPLANWFIEKITYEVNQQLLNLLHCLSELQQESVVKAVAPKIDEVNLFRVILNRADCATLCYVLQHSDNRLRTFNLGYTNIGIQGLKRLQPLLHRCQTLYLRYNSLDKEAAEIEADILKSPSCQIKSLLMCGNSIGSEGVQCLWEALKYNQTLEELYVDITGITDSGLDNLLPSLANNRTLRLLTIVGNKLSDRGKEVLLKLQKYLPNLKILSSFMGDMGLLQAYLDWVQELRENPQQMESVKHADALHNILFELGKEDSRERPNEVKERAKQLEMEIRQLLEASKEVG
ncbi:NACHT, LRR and PYD domains-containing protein 6-like [Pyxicephalus adspersus]|uniref:NACHT, LRR and PYD domains-containing protein 6-like n=1 Tax=Pyxicephalus adspersus TaxID=30357 RepID=UPI003B5CA14B